MKSSLASISYSANSTGLLKMPGSKRSRRSATTTWRSPACRRSQDRPEDVGLDRSNESCGLADSTFDVSGPGNKHCFSRSNIPKATDDCRRRPIGLCADAQIEDDGPKIMETYHEGTYRCSCVGHADCRPDVRSPRERGPSVPGQLIIRV